MSGISSGPVSQAEALAAADELEAAIMECLNGQRKAGKLPVEPMVRLAQFARDAVAKEAECEALRKDAERYRWLREEAQYFPSGRAPAVVLCDEHDHLEKGSTQGDWGFISGGSLDAAIDAALMAGKGDS